MSEDFRPASLSASDLHPLQARLFEPTGLASANAVILGATAVPQTYYRRFAAFLARQGIRTLTFDYRGIGESRQGSLRGMGASMTDWGQRDAVAALHWLKDNFPSLPALLVGHSFGGQAIGLTDKLHQVDGALFVAAQFGFYGHWPMPSRLRLGLLWNGVLPVLSHSLGYLPGWAGLNEDLPKKVALEWARWCRHPEYLIGHVPDARERFSRFHSPSVLYSFSDDGYAPSGAVQAFVGALRNSPPVHHHLTPEQLGTRRVGHFGFFRPQLESLWNDALEHLLGFIGQRPRRLSPSEQAPSQMSTARL